MAVFGLFSQKPKAKGKKGTVKKVKIDKSAKKKSKTCEFC